jgi:hypothetical protein
MSGSKEPRDDALRRVDRSTLERLLAAYYRDLGWWVEGAAGEGRLDDAGLVLKRDRDILLLDCRHWGGDRRPDDAVTSLAHAVGRAGATGAILVDRAAFSRADHDAANRHGHIRLIDGDGLHAMLGEVPEQRGQADPLAPPLPTPPLPTPQVTRARTSPMRKARRGAWVWWLIALACLVVFVLLVRALLARTADTAMPPEESRRSMTEPSMQSPTPLASSDVQGAEIDIAPVHVPAPRRTPDTDAATIDGNRRSDEAMRLLESTTPEM